jgi:truncated hemoglobin YjbI
MARRIPSPAAATTTPRVDLYEVLGGTATCRELSAAFYARVDRDHLLRPLFPGTTLRCATEEFAAFLVQFLGGPAEDAQRRWWLSLRESHLRFRLGRKERDAWMSNMIKALDDAQVQEPVRSVLRAFFERSSAYVVNQGPEPSVEDGPSGDSLHQETARRWDAQRALDQAVAAVRRGDVDRAIRLAESDPLQTYNRAVLAGLLGLMIASGHSASLRYVHERLNRDPGLCQEHYAGRTLLHEASRRADLTTVELILRLGADPNGGRHPPLYCVANECNVSGGGPVVRALVRGGALVDAAENVKQCTALHMAARRGNVEVADALLDCGAGIEARDCLGETPLRRAVNCNKTEVAALLLARGADRHSRGSKGRTPMLAARSPAMKRLLQSGDVL